MDTQIQTAVTAQYRPDIQADSNAKPTEQKGKKRSNSKRV